MQLDVTFSENQQSFDVEVGTYYGGGGTGDHTQLSNRDAAEQHPISAITNLQTSLDSKLNIAQGASKAGQFVVIGDDGNITTRELSTWQGGSY